MPDTAESALIRRSLDQLQAWIEDHQYKGYEPFDGLSSYLRPLTFGTLLGEQLLLQVGRQSPLNLRPLMGVRPEESTKGRGYIAWGHLYLHAATGKAEHRAKAEMCLDWLDHHKSKFWTKHSWGNAFDYAARGGRIPRDQPTIVWTSLIGQAFMEAYEQTKEERWLKIADSICSWIVDLPRFKTSTGVCIDYTGIGNGTCTIHNSSMLGAAMLARTGKATRNAGYLALARSAMEFSCTRQLADGAWYYGEDPMHHWVDNFHTGYNLDSLKRYIEYSGDNTWRENLQRGYTYFKEHFFDPDGCPRYYHNRRYPLDIQCAAQAIDTLALFSDQDPPSLVLARKVAGWTIRHMQGRDGHFFYRIYPLIKNRTPMIHWGQATMFKALAHLVALEKQPAPAV